MQTYKAILTLVAAITVLILPQAIFALEMEIEYKALKSKTGTITLGVSVDQAEALGSFAFELEYGGPNLQLEKVDLSGAMTANPSATNPQFLPSSSGLLRFSGLFAEGFDGGGDLMQLTFSLPDTINGDFPVTFRQVRASDIDQQPIEVTPVDGGFQIFTAVTDDGSTLPETTQLLANYPNPFNPATFIPFRLAKPAEVVIHIYSVSGQKVRSLDLGQLQAGHYAGRGRAAYWDGRDSRGQAVASGIYLAAFQAGQMRFSQKLTLLK